MISQEFTLDHIREILRQCAGEPEHLPLDSEIAVRTFEEIGYDSLARLEVCGRIEREYGVRLDTELLSGTSTPADLIAAVNGQLAERLAA
ncbi:acyl carrier protein (plasmid) [Streptomyces sp. NBC_01003]|uniref:acyl carrier protein n=1 Tax=Streptomyces sp. NBC_01003 TaxID=2903714 RepID=UPI002F9125B4|nr:acyl carrier protein [Streptomyces sp. NBC_01003]